MNPFQVTAAPILIGLFYEKLEQVINKERGYNAYIRFQKNSFQFSLKQFKPQVDRSESRGKNGQRQSSRVCFDVSLGEWVFSLNFVYSSVSFNT